MKLPLIFDENGDVSFYSSVIEAETSLEAVDVINNEYVGYDSEGRLLNLTVNSECRSLVFGLIKTKIDSVSISLAEQEPVHADMLRSTLIDFLLRLGSYNDSLKKAPLKDIVGVVQKKIA